MINIRNVTIVGAGTMGHSLAQVFAQAGYEVWLHDLKEEILARAKSLIASNLQTLVELGLLEKKQIPAILGRIHPTTRMEEAGENADFVIEAIIEDAAAKKEMFKTLDRVCPPGAILASNTSYLDIFKFVETKRPTQVLITHWFAPPHIVPLVEIVRGPQTSQQTVDIAKDLWSGTRARNRSSFPNSFPASLPTACKAPWATRSCFFWIMAMPRLRISTWRPKPVSDCACRSWDW